MVTAIIEVALAVEAFSAGDARARKAGTLLFLKDWPVSVALRCTSARRMRTN